MDAARSQAAPQPDSGPGGWIARLNLRYAPRDRCTRLMQRRHHGPLLVQRSFHPEGATCHSYVLHPPGGVVGGDQLTLDAHLEASAEVLITTPAAAKFYRSVGPWATQRQHLTVSADAALEFLPAETILHGGSRVQLENHVHLASSSRFCFWDILCLGRPGSGDHFADGHCRQSLTVFRDGDALLHERLQLDHGDGMLGEAWGLDGRTVLGTLLATPAGPDLVQRLRDELGSVEGLRFGLTLRDGLLQLRCLGFGVEPVRQLLQRAWVLLRQAVIGRAACPPRIWST